MSHWYMAVLVMSSKVEGTPLTEPAVDLQYRLVRADSNDEAYTQALELGGNEGHSYLNAEGQTVSWNCLGLHDLCEIVDDNLVDGTEVYSQIVRADPGSYVVEKERLSCFWSDTNKHKTAAEILDDDSTE
jgi:uncharacterized protein DUF4288